MPCLLKKLNLVVFPFQVWQVPASHGLTLCPSCTAILETFVTMPAEMISPTGCQQRLLFL